MARRAVVALLVLAAPAIAGNGCTCGRSGPRSSAEGAEAGPPPLGDAATVSTSAPASTGSTVPESTDPVFSAPIAAVRIGNMDVVAGLVAKDGIVRVSGLLGDKASWATDALRAVAWTADAELHLQRAGDGLALLWRGLFHGKPGRVVVLLGADGSVRGEPFPVGAAFCATAGGGVWVDQHSDGSAHVVSRLWSEPATKEVSVVSADHDPPSIVCADHTAVLLGNDDDDNLTVAPFVPGEAAPQRPIVAIRDADFGDDDEREHDAYSVADDLGLVRVGSSGALALREIPRGAGPTPWRRLKRTIPADDDLVAIDGDTQNVLLVATHDSEAACPGVGSTAAAVHAIRVDRKTGDDMLLDLAPADCGVTPGPFWISSSPAGQLVAWIVRRAGGPPDAPPISSLAYRLLRADGARPGAIDQPADAMVDGGCDAAGCSVAALVRSAGADAMQPSSIRVFHYP